MTIAFWPLAALVLAGALWVVTLRNLFRSALSLGLVLLGIAGVFLLLDAEFLAFVQILVYVGAILILLVFAVMLTARLQGSAEEPASRQQLPAAVIALGLFLLLARTTAALTARLDAPAAAPVSLASLGQLFVTTLVLPFEVISIVFVAVLVGAVALATARPEGGKG